MTLQELQQAFTEKQEELHIHQFGFIKTKQLVINQGVRDLCVMNACGCYGTNWRCPPGVGTVEECREKIMNYENVFIFTSKHDIEDSYDFEGMMDAKDVHEELSKHIVAYFKELYPQDKLILSGDGACGKCASCTYPDAPCRFPDDVYPTVESYGVEVYKMAQAAGINYINGVNTVTYFGCIMF